MTFYLHNIIFISITLLSTLYNIILYYFTSHNFNTYYVILPTYYIHYLITKNKFLNPCLNNKFPFMFKVLYFFFVFYNTNKALKNINLIIVKYQAIRAALDVICDTFIKYNNLLILIHTFRPF